MSNESIFLDAIETVLAWDLPDELFPNAVYEQFRLMAGLPPDEVCRED